MKTTKIVMGMAAAAVMALSLTGCMGAGNSFAGIIDYSQKRILQLMLKLLHLSIIQMILQVLFVISEDLIEIKKVLQHAL